MTFRQLFFRKRLDADLAEEMREHLAERVEELIAAGVPGNVAEETARKEFGNFSLLEERGREIWRWQKLESVFHDARFGARRLKQSSAFTIVCIVTLALGLGANFALFDLVKTVLLNPLPFRDPSRLVMLYETSDPNDRTTYNVVPTATFTDWQTGSHAFEEMAFWGYDTRNFSGQSGQLPEQLETRKCTWNLFHTLGVPPAYGRFFSAGDDKPGAVATTVLTWSLFQRRFAGDPAVVGSTVLLNNQPYAVIGVLPSWFTYPDTKGQLWTPAYQDMRPNAMHSHGNHLWNVIARLKKGVTSAAAVAEIRAIQARIHKQYPNEPAFKSAGIQPLLDDLTGDFKTPLYVLLAAVGCLLLITCLNVASLLLARSFARRKEIAVRAALGGSAGRIAQEQLIESLLLAFGGGAVAVAVAFTLLRWIVHSRPDIPRIHSLQLDFPLIAFGIGLTLLTGLVSGFLPAISFRRGTLLGFLRESSRTARTGRSHVALRRYLVGIEVAITVILLVGAGLLLKGFLQLRNVNLGCATKNVLTLSLLLPKQTYKAPEQVGLFLDPLLQKIRAFPGVQAAGAITMLPGGGYWSDNMFTIPEHPPQPKGQFQFAIVRGVDTDAFKALEIPILRGRTFTDYDRLNKARNVVISDAFAKKFFANENPLGKHLQLDWSGIKNFKIIGVVGDTPYRITQPVAPMMYFPVDYFNEFSLVVRSAANPLALALPIQKQIAKADPDLGVANVLTMDDVIGKSLSSQSFEATIVAVFAVLSLLLASVGLYGVLSYVVAQRTSEIGIRIALGAPRGDLIRKMLWDGMRPALIGLLFGIAGGVAVTRLMQSLLFHAAPHDVSVFVAVGFVVVLVAAAACFIPAIRASAIDPIAALRRE